MNTPETLVLPLREVGPYSLLDAQKQSVCSFPGPHKAAHRTCVRIAVNAHDDLLAGVNEAIEYITTHAPGDDPTAMTLLSRLHLAAVKAEETGKR